MKTGKEIHSEILALLGEKGWKLSKDTLKTRHATSPNGRCRLWFMEKSIFQSIGAPKSHSVENAYILYVNTQIVSAQDTVSDAIGFFGRDLR